jgi:PAS domain-containing protein
LEKVFATSDKQSCEILMRVEERTLWLNIEANVGETPTDCLLAMTDITKRKQAEESLWVNEAQYRSIIQTAQDGIWRADKEGNLLEVNASYCRLSGYSEQELLTMRVADLENTGTLDETLTDTLKQDEADVTRFSVQHRRKDGNVF